VTVTALHVGYMHTDMVSTLDAPKSDPALIAAAALDGVATGAYEVLADDLTRQVKNSLGQYRAPAHPTVHLPVRRMAQPPPRTIESRSSS
jgi:hypothetical protein